MPLRPGGGLAASLATGVPRRTAAPFSPAGPLFPPAFPRWPLSAYWRLPVALPHPMHFPPFPRGRVTLVWPLLSRAPFFWWSPPPGPRPPRPPRPPPPPAPLSPRDIPTP